MIEPKLVHVYRSKPGILGYFSEWMDRDAYDWDAMRVAYREATRSLDPSTQVGSVIVGGMWSDGVVPLGLGYNQFPLGIADTPARRNDRLIKNMLVVHAEVDAIFDAMDGDNNPSGCTMYAPWSACFECAKLIAHAGIKELVRHDLTGIVDQSILDAMEDRWGDSIRAGDDLLAEAGVVVRSITGRVFEGDSVGVRFNGNLIYP